MTERIALIGMMGVGKTTVGRALAHRLGWTYLDSDEQVRAATGRSVRTIADEDGAAVLHQCEDDALATALATTLSVVIGVAKNSTLSAIEGERDEIARKLGLGPQALGDLVIQSQNNSTSSSEGFHASDSRNGPQADASRQGPRHENGEGARQNRGEDVSSGGDMGSAGRGLGDLLV